MQKGRWRSREQIDNETNKAGDQTAGLTLEVLAREGEIVDFWGEKMKGGSFTADAAKWGSGTAKLETGMGEGMWPLRSRLFIQSLATTSQFTEPIHRATAVDVG